jgi:hypothetical protein
MCSSTLARRADGSAVAAWIWGSFIRTVLQAFSSG